MERNCFERVVATPVVLCKRRRFLPVLLLRPRMADPQTKPAHLRLHLVHGSCSGWGWKSAKAIAICCFARN